jgi:hypothetical protein
MVQFLSVKIYNKFTYSYNIMLDCWNGEPRRRPTFTDLGETLGEMLEESVRMVSHNIMMLRSMYED